MSMPSYLRRSWPPGKESSSARFRATTATRSIWSRPRHCRAPLTRRRVDEPRSGSSNARSIARCAIAWNGMSVSEEALEDVLEHLPALSLLTDDVRRLVAASFEPVTYSFGAVIVREGDPADSFYLLTSGSARVVN